MGLLRSPQPSPLALPGFKVEAYGTSTAMPIGLSRDCKTVYGTPLGCANTLYQSTNDGSSWTLIYTFPESVVGIQELDDGEAIAQMAYDGAVYKSSGWATSHSTATWSRRLVTGIPGTISKGQWSLGHPWAFGNDLIRPNTSRFGVCNEYGPTTTGSGDQSGKARKAYKTDDYGSTWSVLLDLSVRYPAMANLHMHASAYDPYWDRIWISFGDVNNPDGPGNAKLLYSDDRGLTWSAVPIPSDYANTDPTQWTSIAVMKNCLILGGDPKHGFYRIARKGYRKMGAFQLLASITAGNGNMHLPLGFHQNRNQPSAPLLLTGTSQAPYTMGGVFVSLDEGATLTHLWEDPALRGSNKGVQWAIGPTYSGKVLVWTSVSGNDYGFGTHWLARGEIVVPEPGMFDAQLLCTGNASTTVFSYAHGLGVKPSRVYGWPEKVGPCTVTADTTNVIVTFAAAPANAAVIPVQLRYAP